MIQTEDGPKKLTYAQYKAKKKPREVTYPLVTDNDAVIAFKLADVNLRKAKLTGDQQAIDKAQAAADEAEALVRDTTLVFRLRALPRDAYAELKAEHPPKEEDHAEQREYSGDAKAKAAWHTKTFGPALVAACLVEPEVTEAEAEEMRREWNDAEWNGLYGSAIGVNRDATDTAGLTF
jgi:hypothetical protein